MLHVLAGLRQQLGLRLSAVHVHHGLVTGSEAWIEDCRRLCLDLTVPFAVQAVAVDRQHPDGLEAAARYARRLALSAAGADWLALAHHRDDQAETVLFRAIRGAGVRGASGMAEVVRGKNSAPGLWRPLLNVPRQHLLAYAQAQGLRWVDDPSNADSHYSRNFLRHHIMPTLSARFPGASAGLARLARLCGESASLVDEIADQDLSDLAMADGRYRYAASLALSSVRLRNVWRRLLEQAGQAMPDEDRLRELERQFRGTSAVAGLRFAIGAVVLCVYRSAWWVDKNRGESPREPVLWRGEGAVTWGEGTTVRFIEQWGQGLAPAALAGLDCELRCRSGGERLRVQAGAPSRSLKNLFQEAGLPPWLRDEAPLLWVDGRLAWIGGVGVAAEFACGPEQTGLLPSWSEWPCTGACQANQ